ncbi:MAG: hypothetical protein M3539_06355 [Acidobacteriota bacterium]|nr:hypothetical protein [Acidobacteriota bacterium]
MKRCPSCNRTYTDTSLNFCLDDGSPLAVDTGMDPNATIRYTDVHDTNSPPASSRQQTPLLNQVEASAQPRQWAPTPPVHARKKSSAVWWILGGVVIVGVIGVGLVVMLIALASLGSNSNGNTNANANTRNVNARVVNRNGNTNNANVGNVNSNATLPSSMTDDFSEAKWGTGNFAYGDISYENAEYRMRSKKESYLVMYAPSNDYNTTDATVRVTARSVDGTSPASGYGLIIHGEKSAAGQLEDYALLIYTGPEPKYEIIKHKNGNQTAVVPWTSSRVIRTGSNPNQLEIRANSAQLTFYINGQYVDRITDTENFRHGLAGLYTSDTPEVAFDDLEIKR